MLHAAYHQFRFAPLVDNSLSPLGADEMWLCSSYGNTGRVNQSNWSK